MYTFFSPLREEMARVKGELYRFIGPLHLWPIFYLRASVFRYILAGLKLMVPSSVVDRDIFFMGSGGQKLLEEEFSRGVWDYPDSGHYLVIERVGLNRGTFLMRRVRIRLPEYRQVNSSLTDDEVWRLLESVLR